LQENLASSYIEANTPLVSPSSSDTSLQSSGSMVSISAFETSMSTSKQFNITIIGTVVFMYISKLLGSSKFQLCLCSLDIQANSAKLAEASDFSNVPFEYYKFADVFSKTKAEVLAPHCSYDFQINLKEDAQPSVGPIYSLLASKQEALKEFIEKNLNICFI